MGQAISAALRGGRAAMCGGPALAAVGHRGSIGWGHLVHRRTIDTNVFLGTDSSSQCTVLTEYSIAIFSALREQQPHLPIAEIAGATRVASTGGRRSDRPQSLPGGAAAGPIPSGYRQPHRRWINPVLNPSATNFRNTDKYLRCIEAPTVVARPRGRSHGADALLA